LSVTTDPKRIQNLGPMVFVHTEDGGRRIAGCGTLRKILSNFQALGSRNGISIDFIPAYSPRKSVLRIRNDS